jgi:tRNA/tmRNA/rRNA uracil-C5-methylase (TrmA/RlmC/RlmD family)
MKTRQRSFQHWDLEQKIRKESKSICHPWIISRLRLLSQEKSVLEFRIHLFMANHWIYRSRWHFAHQEFATSALEIGLSSTQTLSKNLKNCHLHSIILRKNNLHQIVVNAEKNWINKNSFWQREAQIVLSGKPLRSTRELCLEISISMRPLNTLQSDNTMPISLLLKNEFPSILHCYKYCLELW